MPRDARFDWRVFADATGAGLSTLIPLPIVDVLLERVFRRRMPRSICAARGISADAALLRALGRAEPLFSGRGCLLAPLALAFYVLKRLSRKILYVLTIHEAANGLSTYWHRAYLIDALAQRGELNALPEVGANARHGKRRPTEAAQRDAAQATPTQRIATSNAAQGVGVATAVEEALRHTPTGALRHVARHAMLGVHHVFRDLLGARRFGAEPFFGSIAAVLEEQWGTVSVHLEHVVKRYEALRATDAEREPPPDADGEGSQEAAYDAL